MHLKLNLLFILMAIFTACDSGGEDTGNDGFVVQSYKPAAVTKSNNTEVYAHYMPWFETPQSTGNGNWGYHWTMNKKDPNRMDADGKREIAAHFYPLIGPYASSDEDVLEYHLLLMKYSGIDGVLIDWYGTRDFYDYPANKKNTEVLVKMTEKVGLKFAIVYEDQTLRDGMDSKPEKIAQAKADMRYLETNFFSRDNYIKMNEKPLLMCFGPQVIQEPADWTSVFSVLNVKPLFMPLQYFSGRANNSSATNAQGEFMWTGSDGEMISKYEHIKQFGTWMAGALPGFKDYYVEGGQYPTYPHEEGARLKRDLQLAKDNNAKYLQLITWNDFGEGTMIEPTLEFGYKFLTEIQSFAGTNYSEVLLSDVYRYYTLKKVTNKDELIVKMLRQVHYYFVSLQTDKACELLDEVQARLFTSYND